jgi:predicted RNase H-like HicB family nuclease
LSNSISLDCKQFQALIEVCIYGEIPGVHTQAETPDELTNNLKEVLSLCVEEFTDEELQKLLHFIGIGGSGGLKKFPGSIVRKKHMMN